MDHVHGSNSKNSKMHAEATCDDGDSLIVMKSDGKKNVLGNSSTKSDKYDTSLPGQNPEWSMVSMSPRTPTGSGPLLSPGVSAQDPDWNMLSASPRQSPPIQTMDQPPSYDPNRIPSSVFGRKPTSAMEWSAASNESLFSIHMGNSSFSRDHAVLLGTSEEVTNLNESKNIPSGLHPVTNSKSSLPTVIESAADNDRQSADTGEESQLKEAAKETPKCVPEGTAEDHGKQKVSPDDRAHTALSTPRQSAESGISGGSFKFPILEGGGGTSAPEKVVPEKRSGGGSRSTSVKVVPEKPQSQPQTPGVTANTAVTKRFFCFSCCTLCC